MKNKKKGWGRSPLHYNGNKYSIADQILDIIEKNDFKTIVEPFAGTGIISINSKIKNVFLNDIDFNIINLLKFFRTFNKNDEKEIIELTEKFKLSSDLNIFKDKRKNNGTKGYSEINKSGYIKLRKEYWNNPSPKLLFLLSNYAFNRMLRFNKDGKFNVPVGKGDFSKKQLEYLNNFKNAIKTKTIKFTSSDFRKIKLEQFNNKDTIFYFDPPYLNGIAQYNKFWNSNFEIQLYEYISILNKKGFKFALSNTIFSNGQENLILSNFLKENNFNIFEIKKQYSKTSYNKKNRYDAREILVTNFGGKNGIK